jgi:hypothetical protein
VSVPFRRVAAALAAVVVMSPLLRAPSNDSYPLSTYPMFATDRGAVHGLATAVEIDDDGNVHRLSPELIAGTDEPVLASVTVTTSVRSGSAAELCEEIVARLGVGHVVEVRTETVDVIALVAHDAAPLSVKTHARCGGV